MNNNTLCIATLYLCSYIPDYYITFDSTREAHVYDGHTLTASKLDRLAV